jgi:hypothetical protein
MKSDFLFLTFPANPPFLLAPFQGIVSPADFLFTRQQPRLPKLANEPFSARHEVMKAKKRREGKGRANELLRAVSGSRRSHGERKTNKFVARGEKKTAEEGRKCQERGKSRKKPEKLRRGGKEPPPPVGGH